MTTRRAFLASLAAALPAAVFVRHAHAAAVADLAADDTTLMALAETVLPGELGHVEMARVVHDFQRWIDGYRPGVELVHGYGTSRLEHAGPTPATRWMQQLDSLDAAARRAGRRRRFATLPPAERRALVQDQLDALHATRIPSVGAAPHVALALLGHYYGSAEANDRCYQASIGRQACRPLGTSGRKPLPLLRVGA